jgi:hypothetical protein
LHNFQLTNGTKFREFPAPAMIELKEWLLEIAEKLKEELPNRCFEFNEFHVCLWNIPNELNVSRIFVMEISREMNDIIRQSRQIEGK